MTTGIKLKMRPILKTLLSLLSRNFSILSVQVQFYKRADCPGVTSW
jgi:hypothetical protein